MLDKSGIIDILNSKLSDGSSLTTAVYSISDELLKDETFACKPGCSGICCNQVVGCTKEEMENIIKFTEENGIEVYERNKVFLTKWADYLIDNAKEIERDNLNPLYYWRGKAKCVFMNNENKCDIYPVRPMNCRLITSTEVCKTFEQEGCYRFRYEWQKVLFGIMVDKNFLIPLPNICLYSKAVH